MGTEDLSSNQNDDHATRGNGTRWMTWTQILDLVSIGGWFIASPLRKPRICQVSLLALMAITTGLAFWFCWLDFFWVSKFDPSLEAWNKNDLNRFRWNFVQKSRFVSKLAAFRERLLISSHPIPLPPDQKERGVALLFSTYGGLTLPRLWESWLQDAYDWIHEQKLEDASVPPNESKILRPFLHYFWGFDRDYIADCAPPHLKESTMKRVGHGLYRTLQHNYDFLFSTAFNECPECYFFTTMSQNSVPLKRFKEWYTDLQNDARSRITLFTPVYSATLPAPKSSAWKTLIRPHMQTLVVHKVAEAEDDALREYVWGTEEYWQLYQLSQYVGEGFLKEIRAAYLAEVRHRSYPSCSQTACPFPMEQFECWRQPCHGEVLPGNRKFPFAYASIEESWLRHLMDDQYSFFARKFGAGAMVEYASGHTVEVEEYINQALRLNSTWSQKSDCESPPSFRQMVKYDTFPKMEEALRGTCLPGLKLEYRNKNCTETRMGLGPGDWGAKNWSSGLDILLLSSLTFLGLI